MIIQGLGTVIYYVSDLNRAKAWYANAFGQQPYFDEPFYVGFNIAGYELGLNPDHSVARPGPGGSVAYWRVADIERAVEHFQKAGAQLRAPIYEEKVVESGGRVHYAETAEDARQLILAICREAGARTVTKGKSMVAEEIGLNEHLAAHGIEPVETDLGEYII